MQLSKIKIAGFKSFVDPTVISLPSKLVAIVGPNGCGKSNIIDAVTWVMGESSPKYLRGESLTDVIFNGSGGRKPVGQASVELVFDNSDGAIGGEFASYAEISVKRTINRESDSVYFLNNVRCRKRDIVDLFLGTGLGPRSYSIIGQNTISRFVEAKPDDMRANIEEAAGTSKYKERRHETELRINHTKENLARVNDVCLELEKQLNHLKNQANTAEKFKSLKEQERTLRAQFYAIQWRQLDSKMVDYTLHIQREETALEARNSELSGAEKESENLRHEQRVAQDAFQEVQRRYYAVGNEITRVEQELLHHQERQTQWENDLKQSDRDWQMMKDQQTETEETLSQIEHELLMLMPQCDEAKEGMLKTQTALSHAEEAMQAWQQAWDTFHQTAATYTQTAQVEKTRIEHYVDRMNMLSKRQTQLQSEQGHFNYYELDKELESVSQQAFEADDRLHALAEQLANIRSDIQALQTSQQDAYSSLDKIRSELQRLRGEQASLQALQQTALGQRDHSIAPWLQKHQLTDYQRLAQQLQVEKGYELAVEKALGSMLQAICVDEFSKVTPYLNEIANGHVSVFNASAKSSSPMSHPKAELLLDKIKSALPLNEVLSGVYVCDTLDQALILANQLDAHESIITREGVWLNRAWLRLSRDEDASAGIFAREEALKQVAEKIEQMELTQDALNDRIQEHKEKMLELEASRDQLQVEHQQMQSQSAQLNAKSSVLTQRISEVKMQAERVQRELEECTHQLSEAEEGLSKSRLLFKEAELGLDSQSADKENLIQEREQLRQQVQSYREQLTKEQNEIHAVEIRLEANKSQKSTLQQAMTRLHAQINALSDRKIALQSDLSSLQPVEAVKKSLQRALDKHVTVEVELNSARVAVEALDQEARQQEDKRIVIDREINKLRNSLESLRVEWQGWKVKNDTLMEQIKDTDLILEEVLKSLPEECSSEEWASKLDQTTTRIARLGPINLMAIDEYATCQERKTYLDKQMTDLQEGLVTLEEAIAKIDKESRQRFKEAFDKVNERFQTLFPTVFGGGKAYLELTSDDLLEAGVSVMACPPGKRNSSIYLLSGGEKSLTAIALIFSIFYLNPAPFCLLDEVDAALDDANVLRFTRLVKSMADRTQFIFISHNKITIEMGDHLMGVTMNEPGVSRMVSVDIEKAMTLAGA